MNEGKDKEEEKREKEGHVRWGERDQKLQKMVPKAKRIRGEDLEDLEPILGCTPKSRQ